MATKDRLATALEKAEAPADMTARARDGYYDELDGPLTAPMMQLVMDARVEGLEDIAQRALAGDFNATQDEWDVWWQKRMRVHNDSGAGQIAT